MSRAWRLLLIALVVLACVGLDQVTKELARRHLVTGSFISLLGDAVHIEYGENPGAFMGLGAGASPVTRFLFGVVGVSIIVIVALGFAIGARGLPATQWIGLSVVAGGGIGNLVDRLTRQGLVSDFVRLGLGPVRTGVFNVADVAVVVGVCLLLLSSRQPVADARGERTAADKQ